MALVTVTVFTVLTLVPTLVHLHVFHLWEGGWGARLAAWVWLAIYVARPDRLPHRGGPAGSAAGRVTPPSAGRCPAGCSAVLAVQGLTLFGVGAVMFLGAARVHHLPEGAMSFWPWRLMPLGAQVIGAWLLALAVATALVIWERDLDRLLVPAVTYTAFGVFQLLVALRYWTAGPARLPVGLGLRRGARQHRADRGLRMLGRNAPLTPVGIGTAEALRQHA